MGGYVINLNGFLFLTFSHDWLGVTSTLRPHSFPSIMLLRFWSHAFFHPFPPGMFASLRSALCPVGRRRRPTPRKNGLRNGMGSIRRYGDDVWPKNRIGHIPADYLGSLQGVHPSVYAGIFR